MRTNTQNQHAMEIHTRVPFESFAQTAKKKCIKCNIIVYTNARHSISEHTWS